MPINTKDIPTKRVGRASVLEGPWRLFAKGEINLRSYGVHFIGGIADDVCGTSLRRLSAALGPRLVLAELLDESGNVRGVLDADGFVASIGAEPESAAPEPVPEAVECSADEPDEPIESEPESRPEFVEVTRGELLALDKDELSDFAFDNGVKLDRRRALNGMVDQLTKSGKVRLTSD